jgi:Fe-S cluster assembly protein SufD
VVVNGAVDLDRSRLGTDGPLSLTSLADRLLQGPVDAAPDVSPDEQVDAFALRNLQHGLDGAVLEVAAGAALDEPVHLIDIAVPGVVHHTSCTRIAVRLGAGSSATLVETRIGHGDLVGGSNVRTAAVLDSGATLDHVVLQDLPRQQVHLGSVVVHQADDSTYRSRSFNLGAAYGRLSYDVHLDGTHAKADLAGLYFGREDQTLDQQITVVHAAPNCTSRQSFRGVLDGRSVGVFNGGIDVRPGADGADAAQTNANLLLSERAEANTQPRLEILADEVTCTHGATVGQLDESALYYLRSRGIPVDVARRLLVNAFADQVVDGVAIDAVRSWVIGRLGHGDA